MNYCNCCGIIPVALDYEYCDDCIEEITNYLFRSFTEIGTMEALADIASCDNADTFTYTNPTLIGD